VVTNEQLTVDKNHVVSINYRLTNPAGELIDLSRGEPLQYLHGHGNIVPGLERKLTGRAVGDKDTIVVAPVDGYGERSEAGVRKVPRTAFPEGAELVAGMQVMARASDGGVVPLWVKEVNASEVVIDANHPLAGVTLHFEVEVIGIRDATETELEHGHIHAHGSHGGCGEGGECCGGKNHGDQENCAQDGGCCGGHGHGH
jgi:FKBP-type peptidyl-prolyl cis-trans isomerase SlyD